MADCFVIYCYDGDPIVGVAVSMSVAIDITRDYFDDPDDFVVETLELGYARIEAGDGAVVEIYQENISDGSE